MYDDFDDDGYSNQAQRECAAIRRGYASEEDPKDCPCHGGGWILSDWDTWEKCPVHNRGQMDPETAMGIQSMQQDWWDRWDAMTIAERHATVIEWLRYKKARDEDNNHFECGASVGEQEEVILF